MSQGLRLTHPTKRSCALLIPHPGDPSTGRRPKTLRVELDATGAAIVSETVWAHLEEARAAGWPHELIVANVVAAPPTQRIEVRRGTRGASSLPEHRVARP